MYVVKLNDGRDFLDKCESHFKSHSQR